MPVSLQTQEKSIANVALPDSSGGGKRWPSLVTTATFVALIIYVVFNCALIALVGEERKSTNLWNGTGSITIAVQKFHQLQQRPRVILLGSSLMMYPFWALDKQKYRKQTADIFNQRRSWVIEDELQKTASGEKPVVYSFATFGQMISDAYLYVDQFMKGDRAPEYLVFGIAPRDFHDSDLPAPMSTYVFKRLVDISNFPHYADLYLPTFQDKADFIVGKMCYFYGHRWHLQHEFNRGLEKLYKFLGIKSDTETKSMSDNAGFMMWGSEDVRWKSSAKEYARRYKGIETSKDVPLQMSFLDKILQVCEERKIKVILVNMPLSDINRGLMPAGFFQTYSQQIAQLAAKHANVKMLDLGNAPEFIHYDFWDTSHLNHLGGRKVLDHLLPMLNQTSAEPAR